MAVLLCDFLGYVTKFDMAPSSSREHSLCNVARKPTPSEEATRDLFNQLLWLTSQPAASLSLQHREPAAPDDSRPRPWSCSSDDRKE